MTTDGDKGGKNVSLCNSTSTLFFFPEAYLGLPGTPSPLLVLARPQFLLQIQTLAQATSPPAVMVRWPSGAVLGFRVVISLGSIPRCSLW